MKNERKNELQPIEIRFGMITEHVFMGKTTQHVIIELGEENWCSTSEIVTIDGKKVLGLAGTAGLEDIHKITDEIWSKEEILEAFERYFENFGGTPEAIIEAIELNSAIPPRILV